MNESLKNDSEYKAKLEDNFLKHIGFEHVENLCSDLDSEKENWENIKLPESLDQWFTDFKKLEEKRRKRKNRAARILKYSKRAAIILLFLVGVNYFLFTSVKAYRITFLNSLISIKEKFTQINYDEEKVSDKTNLPENWEGLYYLNDIPQGYTLEMADKDKLKAIMRFQNEQGNYITFTQYFMQTSQQIDSENGEAQKILIKNENGYLSEKDGLKIISWLHSDKAFYLEADEIDVNKMIKIAESIEIKK